MEQLMALMMVEYWAVTSVTSKEPRMEQPTARYSGQPKVELKVTDWVALKVECWVSLKEPKKEKWRVQH